MPPAILLLALLAAFTPAAAATPVLSEPHPFAQRLSVSTSQGEVARLIVDCRITSSRTGGFVMPRRRGPTLYGLICEAADGGMRLRVFSAADLSLLFDHAGGPGLMVRLVPQGLQIAEGEDSLIWDAPDGEAGSPGFLAANGEASGLELSPGEVLPPRLRRQDHALARDPLEPLRLGPATDAPFFTRASTHLLVHLRDEEPEFWRPGGFARVCIPDAGCGYVPEHALAPIGGLDDDSEAAALMSAAFGPRSAEDGCWLRTVDTEDDVLFCLRPQRLFTDIGGRRDMRVLVFAGMGFTPDGPLSRCHACAAALGIVVAEAGGARVMPPHLVGAWGRGPAATDIALAGGDGPGWHVVAGETTNDRGTIVVRHHLFGLAGDEPAWLGTLPGGSTRFEEVAPGVSVERRDGYRLAWDVRPDGSVAPRLVPLDGPDPGVALRRDPATGRYPPQEGR